MQSLGRRYVQYANRYYRRTGSLWEGRYKSSVVQAESYLLACMRYIELNPVRAAMVVDPGGYRWSSYRANGLGQPDARLTPHPLYLGLDVGTCVPLQRLPGAVPSATGCRRGQRGSRGIAAGHAAGKRAVC
jgi:hypothetical protein